MKKRLLGLLLAVVMVMGLVPVSAGAETELPEKCPYCNKAVTWSPLTEENAEDIAVSSGHRYLAFEGEEAFWASKSIPKTVCLYMNGKTITAKEGGSRVFSVNTTGVLNLIGEGTVRGRGNGSTDSNAGTIQVNGALNIYGTTITTTGEEGRTAGSGGVVYLHGSGSVLNLHSGSIVGGHANYGGTMYVAGTANIYGGTLGGGTAAKDGGAVYIRDGGTLNIEGGTVQGGTASGTGGAVHVHQQGNFNMSGGTIDGGTSTKNGGSLYVNNTNGGNVTMSGGTIKGGYSGNAGGAVYIIKNAIFDMTGGKITGGSAKTTGNCVYVPSGAKINLSGDATIEELQCNAVDPARIHVSGVCTGDVAFRYPTGTALEGVVVGTVSEDADLHGADYAIHNQELYMVPRNGNLTISALGYVDPVKTHIAYCEACGKDATWMSYEAVDYENHTYIYSGHYYVESEEDTVNWKLKYIVGNDHVCLDLNGKTLVGSSRAFDITKGVLNIMDSVGGGTVTACGPKNVETVYGGTFFVRENCALNLYGGKLTYTLPTDGRSYVSRGGVVYSRGEVNIYGGEVSDGAAKAGANIYADTASTYVGHVGLYGGVVGGYVKVPGASTNGACIVARGTLTLSGDPQANAVMMTSTTGTPDLSERITVDGSFTGTVKEFSLSNWDGNIDLGQVVNGGDITNASVTFVSTDAKGGVMAIVRDQVMILHNDPAAVVEKDGAYTAYATAQEAIAAAGATGLVILLKDAENIEVSGMVHMDLNGFNVNGAAGNGTLVCMDYATADFTVADGVYGTVTGAACQVAGATIAAPCSDDNYLMITENGAASFHCVKIAIHEAVLRPQNAGIYYKSEILADEMASAQIKTSGVILNAAEAPTLENMETTSIYTTTGTSCLLANILKTDSTEAENLDRSGATVYAGAYVVTADGSVLLGATVSTCLQEQINAIDAGFTYMTIQQKEAYMGLFYAHEELLRNNLTVTNAISIADRKASFDSIDYTPYLCPWNYDVVEAAKADGKIHYYFFAGEGLHISDGQTYKDKWGDAYLMVFPNGQTMLVDSGPLSYAPVVAENLRRMGITHLDAILVTHPHSDHHNGLFSDSAVLNIGFLKEIQVDQVYYRGGSDPESATVDLVARTCRDLNIPCDVMEKGDVLYFGDVKLECVWPLLGDGDSRITGGEEINNMSIVIRVDYGEHSSLLTGDLYMQGEKWVLERVDNSLLDADFLKVPHHGYNTSSSTEFIQAISPELAMAIGRLPIPAKVSDRYASLGVEFLDDRTNGYVEVTGSLDGTLEYTVSRTEAGEVPPSTGDEEVLPDADED